MVIVRAYRPRKVFESGGSNWDDDERGRLAPRARPKAVLEVCAGEGRRLPSGGTGYHPQKRLEILYAKWGNLGQNRTILNKRLVTHKWFSEVA